jgi:outer membrane protein assembly factor BamB
VKTKPFIQPLKLPPAALALLLAALPAGAGDWPQFLGPSRNGVYPGEDLSSTWPEKGPPIRWEKEVGRGFSAPVVAGGRLILFHRAGDEEVLAAFDAESGRPLWSCAQATRFRDQMGIGDDGPRATPAIDSGRVFALGAEGRLIAADLESGKELWSVDTREEYRTAEGYFGAACSPLVEGGRVLLNIGGADGAGIVALEAATGKLAWKATDHEASYSSPVAATLEGERHVFFFTRSGLVDLAPADGRIRFQFPWRARIAASVNAAAPLVIGRRVFISASYQTGAALLEIKEGGFEKLWTADGVLSNHYATSVHHGGFLFGFDGRQEAGPNLRCVELATGKVRWSEDRFGAGTLLLAGDRLLILTEEGELVAAAADPERFRLLARRKLLAPEVRAHPALARGLFFARNQRKLICADLRPAKGG